VTGGVVRIGRNGFGEISNGLGVTRAFLRHQSKQIQTVDMRLRARQDFFAELLSGGQVSEIKTSPRFGRQVIDVPERNRDGQTLVAPETR
jgi:hypothetical protein